MALVNIDSARRKVLEMLDRMAPPAGVQVLSYKRNRWVSVVWLEPGRVLVEERGYETQRMEVDRVDLARVLKTIFKREFPRSRKVRCLRLDHGGQAGRPRKVL